jgi:hypothetical protein
MEFIIRIYDFTFRKSYESRTISTMFVWVIRVNLFYNYFFIHIKMQTTNTFSDTFEERMNILDATNRYKLDI